MSYEVVRDECYISTKIGIVDETGRLAEHVTLPLLLHPFSDIDGWVFCGDPFPLKPISMAMMSENLFFNRLEFSMMARLLVTGLSMHKFNLQHRMHPDIANICNQIIYDGEIRNDPGIGQSLRQKEIIGHVRETKA